MQNVNALVEARNLKNTLLELRNVMEHLHKSQKIKEGDEDDHSTATSSSNESKENGRGEPFVASSSTLHGIAKVRQSSVAIAGDLQGQGMTIAETLVRCGIRKLILFDEEDVTALVDNEKRRWEEEAHPNLDLETYVSNYELNEESFEHFIDRISRGGGGEENEEVPVDLLILPKRENGYVFSDLVVNAAITLTCPLLSVSDDGIVTLELKNEQREIQKGYTMGMAALDFLLGY